MKPPPRESNTGKELHPRRPGGTSEKCASEQGCKQCLGSGGRASGQSKWEALGSEKEWGTGTHAAWALVAVELRGQRLGLGGDLQVSVHTLPTPAG